jgi:hypothetical protein
LTIRKHIPLLALLLVMVMTVQAAAFSLSCHGTASCCCSAELADMDMAAGMTAGCCGGGAFQPCDLENAPSADERYLWVPVTDNVEAYAVALPWVTPADGAADADRSIQLAADRPGPGGPPLYLYLQSFLC